MFPHTVTLYIQETRVDPATMAAESLYHITLLRGVLFTHGLGVNAGRPGETGADEATVYIPFTVDGVGLDGAKKRYVPPDEYAALEDKNRVWTLRPGEDSFFRKGKARSFEPDRGSGVFALRRVTERDFGGDMSHWEIGGA